jgi:hypothetical protein
MLIESILAGVLLGAAVACVTLGGIRRWLQRRAANRYGELIKRELDNSNVEVIAIGLTADGTETGQRTWHGKSLDSELADTFGYRQRVRITL